MTVFEEVVASPGEIPGVKAVLGRSTSRALCLGGRGEPGIPGVFPLPGGSCRRDMEPRTRAPHHARSAAHSKASVVSRFVGMLLDVSALERLDHFFLILNRGQSRTRVQRQGTALRQQPGLVQQAGSLELVALR